MTKKYKGFTLIELLVTIAIIGILATIASVYLVGGRDKARDVKRKADLAQIGRFLSLSCFTPNAGAGDYDLADIASELIARYPQYQNFMAKVPQDPKMGSAAQSYYRYIVSEDSRCALYANLEYEDESVTLTDITVPTPGGGQGVFASPSVGWNGTNKYFQFSN